MKYLDLTPTWRQILPTWLMMHRQAILGDCSNPDLVKANATAEFQNMALGADRWSALCQFVELSLTDSDKFFLIRFVAAHPDLFPDEQPVEVEPAYSWQNCEDCDGTGNDSMHTTVQGGLAACERCSGNGGWNSCDECGEPEDEPHLADCSYKPGASSL